MSSGIFVIDENGELRETQEQPFAQEDLLQRLLADHPMILPGDQINPDLPRRWLLIRREASISDSADGSGRWAVDHLFLDQDGIPTLVEVKRGSNTEIRRTIVGQLLEYAANAVSYWSLETLETMFENNCVSADRDPDSVLSEFLAEDDDPGAFWERVKTNLQAGKVRLLFVADAIPGELRRIVEFLNQQMDPAEVLAVEVQQHMSGPTKVIRSQVFGQTASIRARKGRGSGTAWNEELFMEALEERRGDDVLEPARALLHWAQEHCDVSWGRGAKSGSYIVKFLYGGASYSLFSVYTSGKINVQFETLRSRPAFAAQESRLELLHRLNAIPGIDLKPTQIETWPEIPLLRLIDPASRETFLQAFDWAILHIRSSTLAAR